MLAAMTATLVLLHGFTNTGASWDPVVAALGERYRALAPDIRGHGRASGQRPVSLPAVIADLDALAPGRFELAGYSMGGRIALHVALARPERVARLVLVGASPGLEDELERAERRRADEQLAGEIEAARIEEFAARWARTPVLAGSPPDVAARAHADRLRNTPAGLAAALRGLGTGALPSLWGRLGELAVPVELIVGDRDAKFRAVAARMAARLPDGRVHEVPGAGHAVHLERPEAVVAVLTRAPRPAPQASAPR
jgi:2-succinyl-6-hydroxy-2,4-cyclohexadiene-1-carboxylate synthase